MSRAIWKGAISFGLVHVPVALHPAATESGIDFDWLDRRSMDPVGYRRVNKRTGREVAREHIVRGVKVDGGRYVVLGDDEIRAAYPKTTQTIEIEAFVPFGQLPFTLLDRPYYLEPAARGEKVYALLREAMKASGVAGVARLVMHGKEHLAALVPVGAGLVLNTLRWAAEMRPWDGLKLPPDGAKGAKLKGGELEMARRLIGQMTGRWHPERYADRFAGAIRRLVAKRAAAGRTEVVEPLEAAAEVPDNVVDLGVLLRRSLHGRSSGAAADTAAATKKAPARRRG